MQNVAGGHTAGPAGRSPGLVTWRDAIWRAMTSITCSGVDAWENDLTIDVHVQTDVVSLRNFAEVDEAVTWSPAVSASDLLVDDVGHTKATVGGPAVVDHADAAGVSHGG